MSDDIPSYSQDYSSMDYSSVDCEITSGVIPNPPSPTPTRSRTSAHWTDAEDKILRDGTRAGMSYREIGKVLKRTCMAVTCRANRIGIRKMMRLSKVRVPSTPYAPPESESSTSSQDLARSQDLTPSTASNTTPSTTSSSVPSKTAFGSGKASAFTPSKIPAPTLSLKPTRGVTFAKPPPRPSFKPSLLAKGVYVAVAPTETLRSGTVSVPTPLALTPEKSRPSTRDLLGLSEKAQDLRSTTVPTPTPTLGYRKVREQNDRLKDETAHLKDENTRLKKELEDAKSTVLTYLETIESIKQQYNETLESIKIRYSEEMDALTKQNKEDVKANKSGIITFSGFTSK